tara:strand:- start:20 stop:301 length:282 start_codon:yes stop_codon:yes gene_type:complete
MKYNKFLSLNELYKIIKPIKKELIKKLNFAVTETIKTTMDKIIFHIFSFLVKLFSFSKKNKVKITADEQTWNNWGFAVEDKNRIIGVVKINRR